MKRLITLLSIIGLSTLCRIGAQVNLPQEPIDSTRTYHVELRDGSEVLGRIIEKDSLWIGVKTANIPYVKIPFSSIKRLTLIKTETIKDGIVGIPNPHPTRYFFAPSGYNLKKGEGYYQNAYLFLNSVNYGITDYFSVGGGFELLTTFNADNDDWSPIFFLTPKVGFQVSPKINLGAGMLLANLGPFSSYDDRNKALMLTYGLFTYGTTENNFTLGAGSGWAFGRFIDRPVITANGMYRLGRKTSFITENWFVATKNTEYHYDGNDSWTTNHYKYEAFVSYGIRFFGSKLSVDLGFINSKDILEIVFIGIPYVDFVVKF